jgi:WD40 repeat protein/serine/threonine protein kinase/tetratricopeptide (TPR) repeat protein
MSSEFQRDYLVRLPLPLAQLYARAYNAKDPRTRHDNTYYLFEALIKLAAAPLVAGYLAEVDGGAPRVADLDRLLARLVLPSLGQWVAILRELARYFGGRPDAASHPLGHSWEQLNHAHRDRPALLALYRRIKNGPDGQPTDDRSVSVLGLLDAMVQYRNGVFGHGGPRFASFYADEMGPLLFPAANDLLAEGLFEPLGVRGSRLVFVTELRTREDGRVEAGLRELIGTQGERSAPLVLDRALGGSLVPERVAVLWPGWPAPMRLDPLLLYREGELADELLFLNRDRDGRQVEYLSYTTGQTVRDRSLAASLAVLLTRVTGHEVGEDQIEELAQQSLAETPSVETLLRPPPPSGRTLGDFEILSELGRGGMGVVYLARQLSLGRLVALKMLPADLAGDEVALARFRREMRLLARCEHPHIVKLLASGTMPDGRLYYAMEYVPGCDLEQVWRELAGPNRRGDASSLAGSTWVRAVVSASRKRREPAAGQDPAPVPTEENGDVPLAATPLPRLPEIPSADEDPGGYPRRVAAMVRNAALALQAVHDQDIVHRDVKPANLMLTPDSTRVVLMDFGLAKGQSLDLSTGQGGGLLGTLRYAAPEQLAARNLKVGPAADVRGLGVTLWELLTRRRLFEEAEDEAQLAELVHDHDVPRLRSVDPSLDADLEAIVSRATERRAADRIASARLLADYLQMYLDGQTLPIRPPGPRELLARWVRRHRLLVGSAAAVAVLIVATTATAFVLIDQARVHAEKSAQAESIAHQAESIARRDAEIAAIQAQEQSRRADDQARRAEEQRGRAESAARLARAREFASRAAPFLEGTRDRQAALGWAIAAVRAHHPPLDEALTALYGAVQSNHLTAVLPAHGPQDAAWSWSPDGQLITTRDPQGDLIHAAVDGRVIATLDVPPTAEIDDVSWCPDGRALLASTTDGDVQLWDRAGKPLARIKEQRGDPPIIAWNPKAPVLLIADAASLGARISYGSRFRFGRGRQTKANRPAEVHLWDPIRGPIGALDHREKPLLWAGWSSDGSLLATLADGPPNAGAGTAPPGPVLRLWDARGALRRTIVIGESVKRLGWVPRRPLLWTSDGARSVRIWTTEGTATALREPPDRDFQEFHWSPTGQALVLHYKQNAGWRLWDIDGRPLTSRMGEDPAGARLEQVAWSPDGRRFAIIAAGREREPTGQLWSAEGQRLADLGNPERLVWSPDSRALATQGEEYSLLWDADGLAIARIGSPEQPVSAMTWSPDGRLLAVSSFEDPRRRAGASLRILNDHYEPIAEFPILGWGVVSWSPRGTLLACHGGREVNFFEPRDRPMTTLRGHLHDVTFLAWQPGGTTLASATSGGLDYTDARGQPLTEHPLALWNPDDRVRTTPLESAGDIEGLAWNPKGPGLALRQSRHKGSSWGADLRLLAPRGKLQNTLADCADFDWRPDGQRLAVGTTTEGILLTEVSGRVVNRIETPSGRVVDVLWDPTGSVLASLHEHPSREPARVGRAETGELQVIELRDQVVHLWDADGRSLATLRRAKGAAFLRGWSPDGGLLVIQPAVGPAELWTCSGSRQATLSRRGPPNRAAAGGDEDSLTPGGLLQGGSSGVTAQDQLAWSSDGQVLATCAGGLDPESMGEESSRPEDIRLWDRAGTERGTLAGHRGPIKELVWHPSRPLLASAGSDRTVRFWDGQGHALYRLEGHEGPVERLAWNPAGTILASLSSDRTVRLWHPDGHPIATLAGDRWSRFPLASRTKVGPGIILLDQKPSRFSLTWSSDGRWLAGSFNGPTVRVWPVDFAQLYDEAMTRLVLQSRWIPASTSQPAWDPGPGMTAWLSPVAGGASTPPGSVEEMTRRADELSGRRRFGPALDLLDEALGRQPGSPELLRRRGDLRAAMGDDERAIGDYQAAARLAPGDATLHVRLGDAYSRLNQLERAVAELHRAAALDASDSLHPRTKAGRIAYRLYAAQKSVFVSTGVLTWLREAIELDRANRVAYAREAAASAGRSQEVTPREFVAMISPAIEDDPEDARLRHLRAVTWREAGDLARAIADYDRLVEKAPDVMAYRLGRSVCHSARGVADKAAADYARAAALSGVFQLEIDVHSASEPPETWTLEVARLSSWRAPPQADWWLARARGLIQAVAASWPEALADFQQAVAGQPDDVESWRGLALARMRRRAFNADFRGAENN